MSKKTILISAAVFCVIIIIVLKNTNCKKNIRPAPKNIPVKQLAVKPANIKNAYTKRSTYFSLPSYSGTGAIGLENYQGKPVLIFFFSIYCYYCKKAAPFLQTLNETLNEKGLEIVGIAIDDPNEPINLFIDKFKLTFPVAVDTKYIASLTGTPALTIYNNVGATS